jgi:hypothetical protein
LGVNDYDFMPLAEANLDIYVWNNLLYVCSQRRQEALGSPLLEKGVMSRVLRSRARNKRGVKRRNKKGNL